ncbi:MAG TPA: preprotein translocase subunit SecE [Candidatus Marinimicrobia bacterium]|nr:preprotein translocase subunit SecE [Candidatus Neomarinimicrobiota bacterium]|tara:strand:+ start:50 stop:232 length:183 start_codon:yes stop_codon:yes gene_type:complete
MIKKTKKFLEDVQFEMKKVSWPTFDELRGAVYVVLTLSLLVAVFLFIVDLLLNRAMSVLL